jgi:quercetin dioxygenase-like cupin family protein
MFETYRMLGRERQNDLEREAGRAHASAAYQKEGRGMKRFILLLAALAILTGGAVALAAHVPQVDPATVPTGFLAAHNSIADVPVGPFKRAVKRNGADFFVQHVRIGANGATPWHTHPGPAFVQVVKGSLTYEDACVTAVYGAGEGFVDRGFGHVHRAIAGSEGVDFYVVYVLPPDSATHVVAAEPPSACRGGERDDND